MTNKTFKIMALPILALALAACFIQSKPKNDREKDQLLLRYVLTGLDKQHFDPQTINDEFAERVFKEYLEVTDPNKKFFLQTDLKELEKIKRKIDDQINEGSYLFLDKATEIFTQRVKDAKIFNDELLSKPFVFTSEEYLELDAKKSTFPKNKEDLKDTWRKYLKYLVMARVADRLELQERAKTKQDTSVEIKSLAKIEEEARDKVKKSQADVFRRYEQLNHEEHLGNYINAILASFDPHTDYYAPKKKEDFDINMSGQLEGIGATLQAEGGFVKVADIVIGGPAYLQGKLKAGDVIMKVAQGKNEPVDIEGMRMDDAIRLIRGKKGTEVRLTVKTSKGDMNTVTIIRDVVKLDNTFAKSSVLENNGIRMGYIFLPQFYANFNQSGGRSCANDVKNELEKLKKENVKGIILDLRNNGGGSLQDVVDMSGLFIQQGPVVQVKSRYETPMVLEDKDPRVQYSGALVVMINNFSASASEILAAAMQDYKRAIIVGSNSFGKGTVQRFIDVPYDMGAMKLTTQKFYRINGDATQIKGVAPDIALVDDYSYLKFGEKDEDFPLKWDEIAPARYQQWSVPLVDVATLKQKSTQRVNNNPLFALEQEKALSFKRLQDDTNYSLNIEKYITQNAKNKAESKKFDDIRKTIEDFKVYTLQDDRSDTESDTTKAKTRQRYNENLQKDIHLFETMQVMKDMI